ncbi:MAG: hypothetical protein KC457_13590, partial [Myxococcales bacterium]|nr:hypothetical protein [Myxococcales bacterium]
TQRDNLEAAKALYDEGKDFFDTADYDQALIRWNRAYVMLDPSEGNRPTRTALAYNIAEAHKRAYEVSRNPEHLNEGMRLLESRRGELAASADQATTVDREENQEIDRRMAELERLLAESQAKGEVPQALPFGTAFIYDDAGSDAQTNDAVQPPPQPQPPAPAPTLSPQQQWKLEIDQDPVLGPKWAKSRKQITGGAVMLGVGGGAALIATGSIILGIPYSPFQWFLLGVGGVFGAASIGLIVGGAVVLSRGTKARDEVLAIKPKPTAWVVPVPMLTRGGAGFGVAGRF